MVTSSQIIGEELFYNMEQKNYIVGSSHLIALECNWDTFLEKTEMFGRKINTIIDDLTSIYFFSDLNISKLIEISNNLIKITYEKDHKIIQKGDKVEDIYYILEGSVKFIEDEHTFKEYHKGCSFGEIFLFNRKPDHGEIIVNSPKCMVFKMKKQFYYLTTLHKGSASNLFNT